MLRTFEPNGTSEGLIHVIEIYREIHPSDWLRVHIKNSGYKIYDWRELPTKYGLIGDALVSGSEETKGLYHRLTTIKDGNRLSLLDSRMAGLEPLQQEPALIMLTDFNLLAPTKHFYAEPFREKLLKGNYTFKFHVSELWEDSDAGT